MRQYKTGPWEDAEDLCLRKCKKLGLTPEDCEINLNRRASSIRTRAIALGIPWRRQIGTSGTCATIKANMSEQKLSEHSTREADERFQRKLFEAMWNYDHLPAGQAKPVRPLILT